MRSHYEPQGPLREDDTAHFSSNRPDRLRLHTHVQQVAGRIRADGRGLSGC